MKSNLEIVIERKIIHLIESSFCYGIEPPNNTKEKIGEAILNGDKIDAKFVMEVADFIIEGVNRFDEDGITLTETERVIQHTRDFNHRNEERWKNDINAVFNNKKRYNLAKRTGVIRIAYLIVNEWRMDDFDFMNILVRPECKRRGIEIRRNY